MTSQGKPYGVWPSGLTPEALAVAGNTFDQLVAAGSRVFWSETRPAEQGRIALIASDPELGVIEWLDQSVSVRTRIHEYGGAAFAPIGEGVIAFDDLGKRIIRSDRPGQMRVLHQAQDACYGDFAADPSRDRVVCVAEVGSRDGGQPSNFLCSLSSDGITPFRRGADFYAYPKFSPDGKAICWVEWDHPAMPWDETRLMVGVLDDSGAVGEVFKVIGNSSTQTAPLQPEFGPGRTLTFLYDPDGMWQPAMVRLDQGWRVASDIISWKLPGECGFPLWQLGSRIYCRLGCRPGAPDREGHAGSLFLQWTNGYDFQPVILDLESGGLRQLAFPYAELADPTTTSDGKVWFRGKGTQRPPEIACYDPGNGELSVIARQTLPDQLQGDDSFLIGGISKPEGVSFGTLESGAATGIYFPPCSTHFHGPEDARPPAILRLHGGPTAAASPAFSLKTQFWTQRGFAVLDLNYRGSTGRGRAFREALYDHWGLVDVEDVILAAETLINRSMVSGVVLSGGSAGGFSVLAALANASCFRGGAVRYGVTDLLSLAHDTHKFESHYLDKLIGPLPEAEDAYIARSPCSWPERIKVPVLLLQGTEDRIVPRDQAQSMARSLSKHSQDVYYREFEGEGHGFRRRESIVGALEAEWAFFGRLFGFTPPVADDACPRFSPQIS